MTDRTPTTAAGRALLAECEDMDWPTLPDVILAIEAEARAPLEAEIERLNARIVSLNAEVLDRMDQWHRGSLARDELARQQNAEIKRLRAALEEPTP